jgi:transcriptional regulator with GAF, ATPase, and Fis domain
MFETNASLAKGYAADPFSANDRAAPLESARGPQDRRGIVGRSAALRAVLQEVDQVAGSDATVLVTGESGTGKELIAGAVHAGSRRRERGLVKVNCAAMPANLIESELFGHERGAFTGATLKREGRFALADGGTLFLDEVGELPLELQAKLLRVLQEGEFEPVGSSRTRRADVRVVAATNRELAALVRAGGFREDLYYRLNVFPIRLPPLRERAEDIPELVASFMQRFAARLGRSFKPVSQDSLQLLQAYPWPGNVRELHNVVERAAVAARDGRLDFARALRVNSVPEPVAAGTTAARILTIMELEKIERANLLLALETTGWRISGENGAARLLDINPSTLASRIKALGLRRPHTGDTRDWPAPTLLAGDRRTAPAAHTMKEIRYA